jgi:hypothetical protein
MNFNEIPVGDEQDQQDKRVVIDVFNCDDWCIHDSSGQLVEDNFVSYNAAFAWAVDNDYDVVEKFN